MDRQNRQIRPVSTGKSNKSNILVVILIIVLILIIIGALIYYFVTIRANNGINIPGQQKPCQNNSNCKVGEVCTSGFCRQLGCQVIASPTNLSASQIGNNIVQLLWNPVPGAIIYRVYIGGTPNFTQFQSIDILTTEITSATTDLTLDALWHFFVVAVDECGESLPSNRITFTLNYQWPQNAMNIIKITDIGNEFGNRGGIYYNELNFLIQVNNNCHNFDNTPEISPGCMWRYDELTKHIQLSDEFGNPDGECLGVEPFNGQNIQITNCELPGPAKNNWVYVPQSQSICLEDNTNLCIHGEGNGVIPPTLRTADGSVEQRWSFIPI